MIDLELLYVNYGPALIQHEDEYIALAPYLRIIIYHWRFNIIYALISAQFSSKG